MATHRIRVTVNGIAHEAEVEPRLLFVHFLRDVLRLTGTHIGCDTGNCGACSIIWNGRLIKSCMMLAVQAHGAEILTVEGLAPHDNELHPIQQAFKAHHAVQCGYCTPGFLLTAKSLLDENPNPSVEEIRFALKGNLCRCTGYEFIVRAIQSVGKQHAQASDVTTAAQAPPGPNILDDLREVDAWEEGAPIRSHPGESER
jgi:carbon-monoxide dehydrogenase small subunit